jgi:hypothetical protein
MPPRLLRLFTDVDAFDPQLSMSVPHQCCRDLQERCLPGAIPSEQGEELAALHLQRDSAQRREVSKGLADIIGFKCESVSHPTSRGAAIECSHA